MKVVKKDTASLEVELEFWQKEALIAQEMLAQVLYSVNEPVKVPKGRSLPEDVAVLVDIDPDNEQIVFSLGEAVDHDIE